jgi:phage terminase large subunit
LKPTKVFFDLLKAYKDGFHTIGLKGSARSGKTRGVIQFLDFVADQSAKHRKLSIGSQSFPHLRDGALYEYQKHMMEERIVRHHNKSDHEFHINQSTINYFSADDPTKMIGPDKDIQYWNEINNGITFDIYNSTQIRTKELTIFDWNPAGEFFVHEKGILDEPGVIVVHSTWLDNIDNLTRKQIDFFIRAKKLSKTSDYWRYWWEVYGLGIDAVLLEERIMPMVNRISKVPKDAVEIPSALDFGFFPDPLIFARLYVKKGNGLKDDLYVLPIVYAQKLSINTKSEGATNLVDILAAKGINKQHKIIAESADPEAISQMRGVKFNIEAVVKSTIETSIRLFHDYNIFIVGDSEEADKTYKEFNNYKFKKNKKGVILGVPADGQPDHVIDGTRYVLLSRNSRWSLPR